MGKYLFRAQDSRRKWTHASWNLSISWEVLCEIVLLLQLMGWSNCEVIICFVLFCFGLFHFELFSSPFLSSVLFSHNLPFLLFFPMISRSALSFYFPFQRFRQDCRFHLVRCVIIRYFHCGYVRSPPLVSWRQILKRHVFLESHYLRRIPPRPTSKARDIHINLSQLLRLSRIVISHRSVARGVGERGARTLVCCLSWSFDYRSRVRFKTDHCPYS